MIARIDSGLRIVQKCGQTYFDVVFQSCLPQGTHYEVKPCCHEFDETLWSNLLFVLDSG